MIFKKVKYDFVQNYSDNFQKQFISHYMLKNKVTELSTTGKLVIDLKEQTKEIETHIVSKLFQKEIITKQNLKLENIHNYITKQNVKENSNNDVTRNKLTAVFFKKDKEFFKIYYKIIKKIKKKLKFKFLYQKDPFLRFNFPTNNKYDSLLPHVDLAIGHPPGEINLWMPITNTNKFNSFSISDIDKSLVFFGKFGFDFQHYIKKYNKKIWNDANNLLTPYVSKKGKTLIFDSRVMHKSLLNKSNKTRISLDFRILPIEYEKISVFYTGTGYKKQKFVRGKYYSKNIL